MGCFLPLTCFFLKGIPQGCHPLQQGQFIQASTIDFEDNLILVTETQILTLDPCSGSPLSTFDYPFNDKKTIPNCGGIALDLNGNLLISDPFRETIHVFSSSTGVWKKNIGGPTPDNLRLGVNSKYPPLGTFDFPHGIAFDYTEGNLVVCDTDNQRVQIFDSLGTPLWSFGGSGARGQPGGGQLFVPHGIAIDKNGDMAITDTFDQIQIFSREGQFLRKFQIYSKAYWMEGFSQKSKFPQISIDIHGNIVVTADNEGVVIFYDVWHPFELTNN